MAASNEDPCEINWRMRQACHGWLPLSNCAWEQPPVGLT